MQRRSVLVEVSPTELRAAVVSRGRIIASRTTDLWIPNWKEAWPGVLTGLGAGLRTMLAELDAPGLPAVVLYEGPQVVASVYSCPAAAGVKAAERAARLALSESTEFGLGSAPTLLARLAVDRAPAQEAGAEEAADALQIHTLGAADPEPSIRAVTDLAATCGLRVQGVLPSEALALAATVARALEASAEPGTAVVLRVGSGGCTLAVAADGRLKFVRQIAVGASALVSALMGGPRAKEQETGPVPLDLGRAKAMLGAFGVPARGQDLGSGLTADSVLPLLQPVLQRCIVEIKQSLRFGLPEAERAGARLIVTGPGGALPNLAALVAEQCGLVFTGVSAPGEGSPLRGGAIEDCVAGALRGTDPLQPREQSAGQRLTHIQRGMWIGVAATCALAVMDGGSTWMELGRTIAERDRLRAGEGGSARIIDLDRTLGEREAGLDAARRRLAGWMAPRTRWDALLAAVAEQTPPSIRLAGMDMRFEGATPVCTLRGQAADGPAAPATETINAYVRQLAAMPIVQRCQLGGARRAQGGDTSDQQFEISIALVGLPADLDTAIASAEGRP